MVSSKKPTTRTRILDATWKLIEANRGQGIRMSDIAKAAGVSRQALYLQFDARADLLIATMRHMDEVMGVDTLLEPSRNAANGETRLREFIAAIGRHFPRIQGMARALQAIKDTDDAAKAAWDGRMGAIRHGCEAAINMIAAEDRLMGGWAPNIATDLLWTMLSFQNWSILTEECGWTDQEFIARIQSQAVQSFVIR